MRRFFRKKKEARRPEVYEILALAQFRTPTSTYCPQCLAQIEDTRGADSEPEPDRAGYGLKTLYDCGTAEVEYDMTGISKRIRELPGFLTQYCRRSRSEWPPREYIYCRQRHMLAKDSPSSTGTQHPGPFLWLRCEDP